MNKIQHCLHIPSKDVWAMVGYLFHFFLVLKLSLNFCHAVSKTQVPFKWVPRLAMSFPVF